jgi:hypothetical protein
MAEDKKQAGRTQRAAAANRAERSKAQVEMDQYRARRAAEGAPGGAAASPFSSPMAWAVMPTTQHGGGAGWPLPPSVMPYPTMPYPSAPGPLAGGGGLQMGGAGRSLGQGLGSTLGLSVEAVNALLTGGLRLLQGMAMPSAYAYGYGYGYGHGGHGCGCGGACGCGGGGGCGGCGCDCCGQDCCGSCGCCQPSVGSCC